VKTWIVIVCAVGVGALAAAAMRPAPEPPAPRVPLPRVQGTLPADLAAGLAAARARLAADPADAPAAVRAAEILLRKARVEQNGGYALQAGQTLEALLDEEPSEYSALKMLGAVYASQHRFREAIATADRAIRINGRDAWNYGTIGDAWLELGDYERAFDAFDTMVRLRPDAASYARVSYAHELQGRLPEALRLMRMALEATSPHDAESLAWHHVQIGHLLTTIGDPEAAARELGHAEFIFPGYTARAVPSRRPGSGT
jgi:tetratricopeptide (TPR) repeat protein